jgi:hypothetical protein
VQKKNTDARLFGLLKKRSAGAEKNRTRESKKG